MARHFDLLAAEQVTAILGFLPAADLFQASAVCQDWAAPDRQAFLWRALVLERWAWAAAGSSNQDMTVPSIGTTWKGCFAMLHAQSAPPKQPVRRDGHAVCQKIHEEYEFSITVAHDGCLVMQAPAFWHHEVQGITWRPGECILVPRFGEQSWEVGMNKGTDTPFGCLGELVLCVWVQRKYDAKKALYVMMRRNGPDGVQAEDGTLRIEFLGVRPAWFDSLLRLDEQLIACSWPTSRTGKQLNDFANYKHVNTADDGTQSTLPEWGVELNLQFQDSEDEDDSEDSEDDIQDEEDVVVAAPPEDESEEEEEEEPPPARPRRGSVRRITYGR